MDIKQILNAPKNTLNIYVHKRALILRALIKSNFVLKEAHKLNYENNEISYNTYLKEFLTYFPEGVEEIKNLYFLQKNLEN